jgi:4-azaleucine resistance transporter AzlC
VPEPEPSRGTIVRSAVGIGAYAGAFGVSFGAISTSSGLTVLQTMILSLIMFSGGSQFAFVGVTAAGSPLLAIPTALLLAVRNAFYGVTLSEILPKLGWKKPLVAHLVIDETTAMAVGQQHRWAQRYAFFATGLILFVLWQTGSLIGALVGASIGTQAFGLDVAAPAAFAALLWPSLTTTRARLVAIAGGALAFALIPVAPAGVPVIAAAVVAVVGGLTEGHPPAGATATEAAR